MSVGLRYATTLLCYNRRNPQGRTARPTYEKSKTYAVLSVACPTSSHQNGKHGFYKHVASYDGTMIDEAESPHNRDLYESELYSSYTETEIIEIQSLMGDWDRATYPTLACSIVKHAKKHGFTGEYLRYLRKGSNFNRKGARKKLLPDGAIRWNKGSEFLIERNGKIVTYGENA